MLVPSAPMNVSHKTLARLAVSFAPLTVVAAVAAAVALARTDNPAVLLLVGPMAMLTGLLGVWANKREESD